MATYNARKLTLIKGEDTYNIDPVTKVNGISGSEINCFCTCSTNAATNTKVASVTSGTFTLEAGAVVAVKFSFANTATSDLKLNINSTGAKSIYIGGIQVGSTNYGDLKNTCIFIYDGTYYQLVGYGIEKANKYDTVLSSTLSRGRKSNTTVGSASFAFGNSVEASGAYSHAEGNGTIASGSYSHAEGNSSTASNTASHAEGNSTASGQYSHAEGNNSTASGNYSHAEGNSMASGIRSHAECASSASGQDSHAEGYESKAFGANSHAEGYMSIAIGESSHAQGYNTTSNAYQHAFGKYNIPIVKNDSSTGPAAWNASTTYTVGNQVEYNSLYYLCISSNTNKTPVNSEYWMRCFYTDKQTAEVVGCGTGTGFSNQKNIRTLDEDGNEHLLGDLYVHADTGCYTGGNKVATVADFSDADIGLTIHTTDWSSTTPYTYTWTDSRITSTCSVDIDFASGAQNCNVQYLDYTKATGSITFIADVQPDADLPIIIHVQNTDATNVANPSADQVTQTAISGVLDVNSALSALDSDLSKVAVSNNIGTFSTKADLDSALNSLLYSMNLNDRYAFTFKTNAVFDVFQSGWDVFGMLYKSNSANADIYSYVEFRPNGIADIIYGAKSADTEWKYLSLDSNLSNKSNMFNFGNDVTASEFYTDVYSALTSNGQTGTVYATTTGINNITGGVITGRGACYGTLVRVNSSAVRMLLSFSEGDVVAIEITGITSSSFGTTAILSAAKDILITKTPSNGIVTLNIPNNSINLLIGEWNSGSRAFILLVHKYGSANINATEIFKGSNVSISASDNTLTLDGGSTTNDLNIKSINIRGGQIS